MDCGKRGWEGGGGGRYDRWRAYGRIGLPIMSFLQVHHEGSDLKRRQEVMETGGVEINGRRRTRDEGRTDCLSCKASHPKPVMCRRQQTRCFPLFLFFSVGGFGSDMVSLVPVLTSVVRIADKLSIIKNYRFKQVSNATRNS